MNNTTFNNSYRTTGVGTALVLILIMLFTNKNLAPLLTNEIFDSIVALTAGYFFYRLFSMSSLLLSTSKTAFVLKTGLACGVLLVSVRHFFCIAFEKLKPWTISLPSQTATDSLDFLFDFGLFFFVNVLVLAIKAYQDKQRIWSNYILLCLALIAGLIAAAYLLAIGAVLVHADVYPKIPAASLKFGSSGVMLVSLLFIPLLCMVVIIFIYTISKWNKVDRRSWLSPLLISIVLTVLSAELGNVLYLVELLLK